MSDDSFLTEPDQALLAFLAQRSEELRTVLCTLARLGVRWRRADDARCRAWLDQLEPHPFYKGGQVLFDLLEWEDFMLDGEAHPASEAVLQDFFNRVAHGLGELADLKPIPGDLPQLEAGFHLYRDVVLGLIWLAVQAAIERTPR